MTNEEASAIAKAKLEAYKPLSAERLNQLETDLYRALVGVADGPAGGPADGSPIGVRIVADPRRWRTFFYAEWRDSGIVSAYINAIIGSGDRVKWPELRDMVAKNLQECRTVKTADAALLAQRAKKK